MEPPQLLAGRYRLIAIRDTAVLAPPDVPVPPRSEVDAPAFFKITRWQAHDEVLGRAVTVSTVRVPPNGDEARADRVRAETAAAAALKHPNVEDLVGHGETHSPEGGSVVFTVAEPVEGSTLSDRFATGRLPWRQAVETCAQIAAGLSAAHAADLAHHRLSPGNVAITASGLKIINFGTAGVGQAEYLAPEQIASGRDASGTAADVYALGLLLYQALAGGLPPERAAAGEAAGTLNLSYASPPPVPGLPVEVISLCRRCLRMDPTDRPTSATVARQLADAARTSVKIVQPRPDTGSEPGVAPEAWQDPEATEPIVIEGEIVWESSKRGPRPERSLSPRIKLGVSVLSAAVVIALIAGILAVVFQGRPTSGAAEASAPPSAPASDAAPSPSQNGTGCSIKASLDGTWDAGATLRLTLTNSGQSRIQGWKIGFILAEGLTIGEGRNGTWNQENTRVTVQDVGYNALLEPGEFLDNLRAGLQGRPAADQPVAVAFTLNGLLCKTEV